MEESHDHSDTPPRTSLTQKKEEKRKEEEEKEKEHSNAEIYERALRLANSNIYTNDQLLLLLPQIMYDFRYSPIVCVNMVAETTMVCGCSAEF